MTRSPLLPMLSAPLALAALTLSPPAHAGPTVSANLDLGTSVGSSTGGPMGDYPPVAVEGFRVRGGWRFDLGPIWLVPEIGAGYDVLYYFVGSVSLPRVFGGARAGVSLPLAPTLRFEPGIYGHVGYAYFGDALLPGNAMTNDVGLALDLRLLQRILVGAHVGYEVVTTWQPAMTTPLPGGTPMAYTVAYAEKWIGYGVHAGVLFW